MNFERISIEAEYLFRNQLLPKQKEYEDDENSSYVLKNRSFISVMEAYVINICVN